MGWQQWFKIPQLFYNKTAATQQIITSLHTPSFSKLENCLHRLQQTRSPLEVQVHNLPTKRSYQTFVVQILSVGNQLPKSANKDSFEGNDPIGLKIEIDELYPAPPYRFVVPGSKIRLRSQEQGVCTLIDAVVFKITDNSILVEILDWQRLQQRRHHRALVNHFKQFQIEINETARKLQRNAHIEDISGSGLLVSTLSSPPISPPLNINERLKIQIRAKDFDSIEAVVSIRHAMPINYRKKIMLGLEIEEFRSEVDELRFDQLNRQMRLYAFNMPSSGFESH